MIHGCELDPRHQIGTREQIITLICCKSVLLLLAKIEKNEKSGWSV